MQLQACLPRIGTINTLILQINEFSLRNFCDNTDDLQRLLTSIFVEPYQRKISISILGKFRGWGVHSCTPLLHFCLLNERDVWLHKGIFHFPVNEFPEHVNYRFLTGFTAGQIRFNIEIVKMESGWAPLLYGYM